MAREIVLSASPQAVWEAMTRDEHLAAWFGAEVELDPKPGGALAFRWPDGAHKRGVVEAIDPPRLFAFRWRSITRTREGFHVGEATRVEFVIEAVPEGTRLTVTEELLSFGRDRSGRGLEPFSDAMVRA